MTTKVILHGKKVRTSRFRYISDPVPEYVEIASVANTVRVQRAEAVKGGWGFSASATLRGGKMKSAQCDDEGHEVRRGRKKLSLGPNSQAVSST